MLRKTKAELTDEGFYDEEFAKIAAKSKKRKSGVESLTPSEPSAVRTILARAKEVLQSLASDNSKFQAVVEKRGRIAHNRSSTMEETNNPDIVKKSGMPQQVVAEATVVGLHVPEPALVRDIAKETAGVFEMKSGTPPSAKTPPEIPMFGNVP